MRKELLFFIKLYDLKIYGFYYVYYRIWYVIMKEGGKSLKILFFG